MQRPDCDLNALDSDGNTPLMCAVLCKRFKILETWLKDKELVKKVDLNLVNDEGKTILMLLLEHSHLKMFRMFLHTADAKKSINKVDNDSNTALLLASQMGKWAFVKEILINRGLKIQGKEPYTIVWAKIQPLISPPRKS